MFTIEHEFDATVVTSFAECLTVEQFDTRTDTIMKITLSPEQVRDLAAALDLPEGAYQFSRI
jgi:hypothetical protein